MNIRAWHTLRASPIHSAHTPLTHFAIILRTYTPYTRYNRVTHPCITTLAHSRCTYSPHTRYVPHTQIPTPHTHGAHKVLTHDTHLTHVTCLTLTLRSHSAPAGLAYITSLTLTAHKQFARRYVPHTRYLPHTHITTSQSTYGPGIHYEPHTHIRQLSDIPEYIGSERLPEVA